MLNTRIKKMIEKNTERLGFLVVAAVLLVTFAYAAGVYDDRFTDVKANDWFYDAVAFSYEEGLVSGTTATTFGPAQTMSRGQFVTVLGRIDRVNTDKVVNTGKFADVINGSYYEPYVYWANANSIVTGSSETAFEPDGDLTREAMATVIAKYLTYKEVSFDDDPDAVEGFNDAGMINTWAVDSVEVLRKSGMVGGDDNGSFNPQKSMTRAEGVTILKGLMEKLREIGIEVGNGEPIADPTPTPEPKAPIGERWPEDEWLAAFNKEAIRLINEARAEAGVTPLVYNDFLQEGANIRAEELLISYAHMRPDGSSCFTAYKADGGGHGECLAGSGYLSDERANDMAAYCVNGWLNSPGHRAILLAGDSASVTLSYSSDNLKRTTYYVLVTSTYVAAEPGEEVPCWGVWTLPSVLTVSLSSPYSYNGYFSIVLDFVPANATTGTACVVESSDTSVVEVRDVIGQLRALSLGTTTITATLENGYQVKRIIEVTE